MTFHFVVFFLNTNYNIDKGEMIMMSKKSGLTKRQKTIIQMLAQFTFSNPVTVQAISEKLRLSSRTILRELPKIEQWMVENDFHMVRKPRVGIYLEEDQEGRNLLLQLVEADHTKGTQMDKEDRLFHITHEILASYDPLKYYYFTSKFGISEGTLSSDLDEIEKWLENYGLSLIRRKGLGVYWHGSEQDYRQAVVALLIAELSHEDSDVSDERKARRSKLPLFSLYSEELMTSTEDIIKSVEQSLQLRYTDNAFRRMAIFLMITIQRIKGGFDIQNFVADMETLMRYPEYQAATWVGSVIEASLDISITQAEIEAITMQLLSAKVWQPQMMNKYKTENIKTRQLVIHLILKIEELLDMDFLDDRMLIDGLCNHMGPALSRMKMHVHIENPSVSMLKQKYSEIFEAVMIASKILLGRTGIDTISDEELGFIALHFCAAAEKNSSKKSRIAVLVACPNGVGTSHMLAVHLQKAFPEIMVRKVISASDVDMKVLSDEGIALVVSTVQLDIDYPNVCVNPVLLENDRMMVRNAIKDIKKTENPQRKVFQKHRVRRKEIEYFVTLGTEMLQVIDNVKISTMDMVESKEELIRTAANLYARNNRYADIIEQDIIKRERTAGTYISTFQMLFLHCKTKGVVHCRFGYISLKEPLQSEEGVILGAIVMLVPDVHKEQQEIYKEVMSEVSGSLAEDEQIVACLIQKKRNEVSFELEKCLGNYCQRIMKEYGDI